MNKGKAERLFGNKNKIREGNKLIAEFMGYKDLSGSTRYCFDNNLMSYHSSWDWLMPVVEKIEENFIVCIWWDCCEISAEKKKMTYPPMIQSRAETKILATWDAVIQFIKWYNTQTP